MKGDVKEKVLSLVLGAGTFPASSPCKYVARSRIHAWVFTVFLGR